jgi:hypothetical protein
VEFYVSILLHCIFSAAIVINSINFIWSIDKENENRKKKKKKKNPNTKNYEVMVKEVKDDKL